MGKVYERIDDGLAAFMAAQPMFFVASAPAVGGHVNVSPKGYADTFTVLGPNHVAYLDLTGSGAETIAHLRQNGRLTVMFCSFDAKPRILRLYGTGRAALPGDEGWADLLARFGEHPGARSVVVLSVERIADSCGFAVPRMSLDGDRPVLDDAHRTRGPEYLREYRATRNVVSIDGLPAFGGQTPAEPAGRP